MKKKIWGVLGVVAVCACVTLSAEVFHWNATDCSAQDVKELKLENNQLLISTNMNPFWKVTGYMAGGNKDNVEVTVTKSFSLFNLFSTQKDYTFSMNHKGKVQLLSKE